MTELLQELKQKLSTLPQEKQAHWVSHFLKELSAEISEVNGNVEDEGQWIGGRKPTPKEVSEAIEKLTQLSKGNILGKDVTLKELINEGRR